METNDFLKAVFELIKLNYPSNSSDGISAARAGVLIRGAFPNFDWGSIGYPKLKHILSSLEAQGLIKTGTNGKHALTIWLIDPMAAVESAPPERSITRVREFLRKDVWNAFILALPHGRRYMNRRNGYVRVAASSAPDDSGDWIEIEPASPAIQKSWTESFLRSHQLLDTPQIRDAMAFDDWYRKIPHELQSINSSLSAGWNRARSQDAVAYVREWCARHSVPEAFLFEGPRLKGGLPAPPAPQPDVPQLRDALLRAIACMSLDELLEIRIPAKYLVEQLLPQAIRAATTTIHGESR